MSQGEDAGTVDAELWRQARATWPGVEVSAEQFAAYLDERGPAACLRTNDLYLACACAQGQPAAIETFEQTFAADIQGALSRMKLQPALVEDVRQQLLDKLFVADEDAAPRITQYSGEGALRNWVRVTATRMALNACRREGRERPADDEVLMALAAPVEDQELVYLKELYRREFKSAFQQAFGALGVRERNIMRHHLLDGLNLEQIGAIYRVHKSTVGRWMAKVRDKLLAETRKALTRELEVSRGEFASIMRLIQSQLEVSMKRVLEEDAS